LAVIVLSLVSWRSAYFKTYSILRTVNLYYFTM